MQSDNRVGSRIVMILLTSILFAAVVFLVGTSLRKNSQDAELSEWRGNGSPSQPVRVETFEQSADFSAYMNESGFPIDGRNLSDYYERRAYLGAPPIVPHPVDTQSIGGNDCLQCHTTGDYVTKYKAYAPIVPHPELLSCNQCHVPVNTTELFVESDWQTVAGPSLGDTVLPDSPPPIQHAPEMRENCISCHAGPAAPVEIRVTHPERENCLQCHVLIETEGEWER